MKYGILALIFISIAGAACTGQSINHPVTVVETEHPTNVKPITTASLLQPSEAQDLQSLLLTIDDLKSVGQEWWKDNNSIKPFPMSLFGEDYCDKCVARIWGDGSGFLSVAILLHDSGVAARARMADLQQGLDKAGYVMSPLSNLSYVDASFPTEYLPEDTEVAYIKQLIQGKTVYTFALLSQEGPRVVTADTMLVSSEPVDDYKSMIWVVVSALNKQWQKLR